MPLESSARAQERTQFTAVPAPTLMLVMLCCAGYTLSVCMVPRQYKWRGMWPSHVSSPKPVASVRRRQPVPARSVVVGAFFAFFHVVWREITSIKSAYHQTHQRTSGGSKVV